MCGIAGIFNFEGIPVERRRLELMADSIRHRGPDDDGFHIDGAAGLAMRRLSIIDLETGAQPIFNEDRSVCVVFNGEIYNYRELRGDLESRGHSFRTESDTEVIAHLYEEYGEDLAGRLNGMFAIALWDSARKKLMLFRDRLGIKPLYYAEYGGELLFGSEMKCLLAAADLPRDADRTGLDFYLRTQYFPFDHTVFRAVRKLMPGHRMTIDAGGRRIEKYWELSFGGCDDSEPRAVERFRELFFKSVERRMIADVPLGAFLSGGIDSAAVLAVMSELKGGGVKTFTIGFGPEAKGYSELSPARVTADHCGADFHGWVVGAGDISSRMDRVLDHFDEPVGGGLHTFLVSELASQHVKVALSGIGSDELLGGYERQKKARLIAACRRTPGPVRKEMLAAMKRVTSIAGFRAAADKLSKLDRLAGAPDRDLYFEWIAVFDDSLRASLYQQDFFDETNLITPGAAAEKVFADRLPGDFDDRISFLELKTTLPDDFLNYTDRMSMAWSLEARVPFLDHELVEYVASLPMSLKLCGGTTKYLLKQAMRGLLPGHVINRRKQPFLLPLGTWLRGVLKPLVENTLLNGELACEPLLRPDAVRRMVALHLDGQADYHWQLWSVMLLEKWIRRFNAAIK